jgi:hypothetical protein
VGVFVVALLAISVVRAATDDAAQRQLREDRERFQREVDRQRTDAQLQAERARQSAEQQRTADELSRLRAAQARQEAETRRLSEAARALTNAPSGNPGPRSAATSSTIPPSAAAGDSPLFPSAAITPDFSVTILPDGNCVVYVKGQSPQVRSAADAREIFSQLLARQKPAASQP